jgi:hypothetical protein
MSDGMSDRELAWLAAIILCALALAFVAQKCDCRSTGEVPARFSRPSA